MLGALNAYEKDSLREYHYRLLKCFESAQRTTDEELCVFGTVVYLFCVFGTVVYLGICFWVARGKDKRLLRESILQWL